MVKKTNETPNFNHVDYRAAAGFVCDFRQPKTATLAALKGKKGLEARTFGLKDIESMASWIEQKNRDGYNIYFHVNNLRDECKNKKAKRADVTSVHAFHVDLDDPSEEALERILAFPIKPSCILFSGGGYQVFWLLNEPLADIDKAEQINAALAKALGGDACQNADRIMRAPETVNWPNAKKRKAGRVPTKAYLLHEHTDFSRTHRVERFEEALSTSTKAVGHTPSTEVPDYRDISIADLNITDSRLVEIVTSGDDPDHPRGTEGARYPSRSEARFSVACALARLGFNAEIIAGVLVNASHGIAESILEKAKPREYAYREAEKAIARATHDWPDVYNNGRPKASFHNALTGLYRLEVTFEHDAFKNRKKIGGHFHNAFHGDVTDDAAAMLRRHFLETFGFDPGKGHLYDAIQVVCLEHTFHPIRDYLKNLEWDGVPRLDTWLSKYLGAEDSAYVRAVGKMMLVAAVRRVRQPGCKFDFMIVLEAKQGVGKSTAIAILAGEDNFSDQNLMALDDKAQMEALEGVWLYEVAELDGMSRAEVSKVKAFISRTEDRGRPAYARFKESWPRQCILIGTTNEDFYLKDTTGNRRFLPVKTYSIDLDALRRDRDQLWAEAAEQEASGASISLAEELWQTAAEIQAERMQADPWLDTLAHVEGIVRDGMERVSTEFLFSDAHLGIPPAHRQAFHPKRIAAVMRELGWNGPKKVRVNAGDKPVRGYERPSNKDDDIAY
ncbi:hypothetical protein MWU53_13430 [Aliiroseovarius sp. S1123]|uniref:VapE domain-containing protein n=1 Tax=unclassified Aliiroseovarius TaxID=2623558 RepID=UPI001FF3369C|nr:VapE domain-containing protein [Aliiroseovarius sp. S1123]MCK0172063.1 hypothetical protein [Aliiroseovarius sp. S1123]